MDFLKNYNELSKFSFCGLLLKKARFLPGLIWIYVGIN